MPVRAKKEEHVIFFLNTTWGPNEFFDFLNVRPFSPKDFFTFLAALAHGVALLAPPVLASLMMNHNKINAVLKLKWLQLFVVYFSLLDRRRRFI